jgi:hypothetical protein
MSNFSSAVEVLRRGSRNWWYHSKLRKQGDHKQARKLEIQSLRSDLMNLRHGKLGGIALNGVWIKSDVWSVSQIPSYYVEVLKAWAPNMPFVDKRTIPEDRLYVYVCKCPIVDAKATSCEGETAFSYVTIGAYCAIWERLGASVHWGNQDREAWINHPIVLAVVESLK